MYKNYFGFTENPFSIAPDPRFLYMSEMHQEALAHLTFGAESDGGCIILLTGEIGTGKTTVCRFFLELLDETTDVAIILNPKLTANELLEAICDEFQISDKASASTIKNHIDRLNDYLLRAHAENRQALLIIDEAQNLDHEVLEMLRLLTNLETNRQKLLKIVLLGQSELLTMLSRPDLRQLNQRITSRYHLKGLVKGDLEVYLSHRIAVAGGGRSRLFDKNAVKKIYALSSGIPRLINTLCDRSLLGAYTEGKDQVSGKIVQKAAREIFGHAKDQNNKSSRFMLLAASTILATLLLIIFWYADLDTPPPAPLSGQQAMNNPPVPLRETNGKVTENDTAGAVQNSEEVLPVKKGAASTDEPRLVLEEPGRKLAENGAAGTVQNTKEILPIKKGTEPIDAPPVVLEEPGRKLAENGAAGTVQNTKEQLPVKKGAESIDEPRVVLEGPGRKLAENGAAGTVQNTKELLPVKKGAESIDEPRMVLEEPGRKLAENDDDAPIQDGKAVYLVKKADNFIILYDRSASMGDIYQGTGMTELDAERKILLEKNATLPDMNWMAGIYSITPGRGLNNLTPYYPMQSYDKELISRTISNMPREPRGETMLQQGLDGLDRLLAPLSGKTVIFLFTDSQYTPIDSLPSPAALARRINTNHDICFSVIDTGSKSKGTAEINALASVNHCSYLIPFTSLLGNPEWMTNSLFRVVEQKPGKTDDIIVALEWQNILFGFDKSEMKPEYYARLSEAGTTIRQNPQSNVILAGHTDNIGSREYNMKLSHRRAASVRDYLTENEGIDADRITLAGFGDDDPVSSNDTPEGRALNRRVQVILSGIE